MKGMTEGERLVWAAAYATALSWRDGNPENAVWHASYAIDELRKEVGKHGYQEVPDLHVRRAREIVN